MVEEKMKVPMEMSKKLRQLVEAFEANRDNLLDTAKELVSLETGGWTNVERLFAIAKKTDLIRIELKDLIEEPDMAATEKAERKEGQASVESTGASPRTLRGKKRKGDYPKYSVRGDTLIKVGLSSDLKTEYEHLVSKSAFTAVIERLTVFKKVDEFTVDELQEELHLPVYQTYIVIAVLKEMGILESPRRGVYSFRGHEDEILDVSRIWSRL